MTVPGAVYIIKELSIKYKSNPNIIIGAGTVLDSETARAVILVGAQYVVSSSFDEEKVKRVPVMPGIMTVVEAFSTLEIGVDILKVFPAKVYGPAIISSLKGPLPQAQFMPTGGVDIDNIDKWIKAGAVAVGTGGSLTAGAKKGDYESVTNAAKAFVDAVKKARE